jgi:hypothetical protein
MNLGFQYNPCTCNIKGCTNQHFSILLCKNHYDQYITDEKIKIIQSNVQKYSFGKQTLKDRTRHLLFFIIHYSTAIHVYYIEHFPLESLFLYHLRDVYKKNGNLNALQYIKDFDYIENESIGSLKSDFKTIDANQNIIQFTSKKGSKSRIYAFLVIYLAFIVLLFISQLLSLTISYHEILSKLPLIFLPCIPVIILGTNFRNSTNDVIKRAMDNKLYKERADNDSLLMASQKIIQSIRRTEETRAGYIGSMLGVCSVATFIAIKEIWGNISFIELLFTSFLLILSIILALLLFSIILENRKVLLIIRRFHKANYNFNLYALDKNIGINYLKTYLRNLILYNVFTIFTYCFTFYLINKQIGVTIPIVVIIMSSLLVNLNFASFYFIAKLHHILKDQFRNSITAEEILLNDSESSDRFQKYSFIKSLKLDLYFRKEFLIKTITYSIPYLITLIIDNHVKLILLIKKIIHNYFI